MAFIGSPPLLHIFDMRMRLPNMLLVTMMHGGSLSKQYYSKLVHIGEFNTIKSGSNILPSIC